MKKFGTLLLSVGLMLSYSANARSFQDYNILINAAASNKDYKLAIHFAKLALNESKTSKNKNEMRGAIGYLYTLLEDHKQANHWFQEAANNGFADAQNELGMNYLYGRGIKKNVKKAHFWVSKACNNGSEKACQNLNENYFIE